MTRAEGRSLSARSVVASTLLGTEPPRLAGRLLVAFAAEFGISEGATRVALTRMVDRGEAVNDDGTYTLAGPLLERRTRQETGLRPHVRPWNGDWELWVAAPGPRAGRDRQALRRSLAHLGLGEQREGVWMRPDNLDPARLPDDRFVATGLATRFVGRPDGDAAALVALLFPVAEWADVAGALEGEMDQAADALRRGEVGSLPGGFTVAAAVLRHLVADPHLPAELAPPDWPSDRLRARYADYDALYRAELARFFSVQKSVASAS